jgi:hypothetical protein
MKTDCQVIKRKTACSNKINMSANIITNAAANAIVANSIIANRGAGGYNQIGQGP